MCGLLGVEHVLLIVECLVMLLSEWDEVIGDELSQGDLLL